MSLVNDMLLDLQNRNAATVQPLDGLQAVTPDSADNTVPVSLRLPLLAVVAGVAVAVTAGWYYYTLVPGMAEESRTLASSGVERIDQTDVTQETGPENVLAIPATAHQAEKPEQATVSSRLPRYRLDYRLAFRPGRKPPHATVSPSRVAKSSDVTAISLASAPALGQRPGPRPKSIPSTAPDSVGSQPPPEQSTNIAGIRRTTIDTPTRLRTGGLAALRAGHAERAEALFRQLIAMDETRAESYLLLHRALAAQSRGRAAQDVLHDALRTVGQPATVASLLAHELLAQDRVDDARTLLETHRPATRGDLSYEAMLAAVYQRSQMHDKAIAVYRALLVRKPANGAWWIGLAISNEALGEREAAVAAFQRARSIVGTDPTLIKYAGLRLASLGADT